MTVAEVVVIAAAIILAIAILTAAVFVARRIHRDEPGPTYYDPDLYRAVVIGTAGNGGCCGGAGWGGGESLGPPPVRQRHAPSTATAALNRPATA